MSPFDTGEGGGGVGMTSPLPPFRRQAATCTVPTFNAKAYKAGRSIDDVGSLYSSCRSKRKAEWGWFAVGREGRRITERPGGCILESSSLIYVVHKNSAPESVNSEFSLERPNAYGGMGKRSV
jgi:hypothetical protein